MAGQNQPDTFERRGVAVDFEQRQLKHTRVRSDEAGGLEALIPNYMGGGRRQRVVLPWKQVPGAAQLDARDLALVEAIGEVEPASALDHYQMRAVTLAVDAERHRNPAVRLQARAALDRGAEDRLNVKLSCVAQLTRECGVRIGDAFMASATTAKLIELMRGSGDGRRVDLDALSARVIHYASLAGKTTPDEARRRVDALVDVLGPFGPVVVEGEAQADSYLHGLRDRLARSGRQITMFKRGRREEVVDKAAAIGVSIEQFLGYVDERLAELRRRLANLTAIFERHDEAAPRIARLRRDVGYALDGWPLLLDGWDVAQRGLTLVGGEEGGDRAILDLAQFLPEMPPRELHPVEEEDRPERARVRMVREMHGWSSDTPDTELLARIQRARDKSS